MSRDPLEILAQRAHLEPRVLLDDPVLVVLQEDQDSLEDPEVQVLVGQLETQELLE